LNSNGPTTLFVPIKPLKNQVESSLDTATHSNSKVLEHMKWSPHQMASGIGPNNNV
jgi:hypothetical protein